MIFDSINTYFKRTVNFNRIQTEKHEGRLNQSRDLPFPQRTKSGSHGRLRCKLFAMISFEVC